MSVEQILHRLKQDTLGQTVSVNGLIGCYQQSAEWRDAYAYLLRHRKRHCKDAPKALLLGSRRQHSKFFVLVAAYAAG